MNEVLEIIELKTPAKQEYVGVVRLTVSGIANRLGYSYDDIEDIKIAVAEACANVVNNPYSDTTIERDMFITCGIYSDRIEISVADQRSFVETNRLKEEGPIRMTDTNEHLKEGGLSLYLIETLMDRVEVSGNSGVVIAMTKFLHRSEVEHSGDSIPRETTE